LLIPNSALRAPVILQLYPEQFSRLLISRVAPPPEFDGKAVTY
jgi:hypothetical protein